MCTHNEASSALLSFLFSFLFLFLFLFLVFNAHRHIVIEAARKAEA